MRSGRVEGKVALVTGGASGIGAAISRMLAHEGAKVIIGDIASGSAADADVLRLDVADPSAWQDVERNISARYGRLDILVHNAGICVPGGLDAVDTAAWARHHAVMAAPIVFGTQALLPMLRASDHASVVVIASITAKRGFADIVAYSSAKGAALAATRSIAVFAQDEGLKLRCNAVCPGDIETPMQQTYDGREARVVPPGVLPKGAAGDPDDVAHAVVYLASDAARFVTGIELIVDNGATLRPGW